MNDQQTRSDLESGHRIGLVRRSQRDKPAVGDLRLALIADKAREEIRRAMKWPKDPDYLLANGYKLRVTIRKDGRKLIVVHETDDPSLDDHPKIMLGITRKPIDQGRDILNRLVPMIEARKIKADQAVELLKSQRSEE